MDQAGSETLREFSFSWEDSHQEPGAYAIAWSWFAIFLGSET